MIPNKLKNNNDENQNLFIFKEQNINDNEDENLLDDNIKFSLNNQDNNKDELKKLFLDEIFFQKYSAKNYEIPNNLFYEVKVPSDGNCFYSCLSYHFYKTIEKHLEIREAIFQYISDNEEDFYIFFEGNDEVKLDKYSPKVLLENYIMKYNREGEFAGDIEYTAICKLYNMQIILLTRGFEGFNVFNIYNEEDNINDNKSNIYVLFLNNNHFNYLKVNIENNSDVEENTSLIFKLIDNNLNEWKNIRKKEYPLSLKWYPEIYREMFCFYKYGIIPEERFNNTTNPRVYINRFRELAKKSFYFSNERLYFIKKSETNRLPNGNFEDINKVILKKIPYIFEIIPKIHEIHDQNGHISYRNLSKKFCEDEFYIDSIDLIAQEYLKQCPECYAKFYCKKMIKYPMQIQDEGPHYRLLIDITYLDSKYYSKKTNYKYIIDCIDHFSKFYWAYLIREKTAETTLCKIKLFIAINKKPIIIQTDNGLEFKNKLLENYLKNEGIKHIYSRPHHPQTNGCLERFHRELHKHMKNYLDNYKDFNDSNIENALDDYILYHNNTIKSSTRYTPNEIRDLTDKNLIEIIINNMIKSFKKHTIDINEILDKDEKLLLWNKLILKNEIYIKNTQEKKGEFLYPCIFQNYINTETIKISFEIDINNQFKKDTAIFCNLDCLIIIPEFVYNYFIIKNKRNIFFNNMENIDNVKDKDNILDDSIDYMKFNNLFDSEEYISVKSDKKQDEIIPIFEEQQNKDDIDINMRVKEEDINEENSSNNNKTKKKNKKKGKKK